MEDLQVIIYIIFGIIYLIFGALKKRRQEQNTGTPPLFDEDETEVMGRRRAEDVFQDHRPADHREPGSLEELLDRYEEAAQRAKQRAAGKIETVQEQVDEEFIPVASNEPTIRNMEAEALEQMQRTEKLKALQEELPAKARVEVFKQQQQQEQRPAQIKVKRKRKDKRFLPYENDNTAPRRLQQLRKALGTKQGLQQAVMLSEILNRKHF